MSLTGGTQATWASTSDGRPTGRFDPREGHDRRAVARTDGGGVDGDDGARHLGTSDQAR